MVFGLDLVPLLALGLVSVAALVYGAEHVVDKLTSIAEYYGIPDVVIAMSIISIGTSLPELMSHLVASYGILARTLDYEIASAMVLGANIGSDVVQQTLVVGLVILGYILMNVRRDVNITGDWHHMAHDVGTATRSTSFQFDVAFLKIDYLPMIGTTLMTLVLAWDGVLSRLDGLVLFGSFLAYMYFLYHTRDDRLNHRTEESENLRWDAFVAITALVMVLASAHILLKVTETIVAETGLGGSLIGVMTLGIAAALPELFTALEGIRQRASGIALGTLIGSNITNPLLAIGIGSIISTYWVPRPLVLWDLPMETFTAAMLLGYLLFVSDRKLGIWGGLYLVGLYLFYVVIRFAFFAMD